MIAVNPQPQTFSTNPIKESAATSKLPTTKIGNRKEILEIGCGPGVLSQALARWYPEAEVTGTDMDSAFIEFARKEAPDIQFCEEDATKLSFADESFDVSISNTVAEHIEPSKFFGEQYRVLKPGGVCLVLSARRGVNILASCILENTAFENDIWERVQPRFGEVDKKHHVCAYPMNEAEYPLCMEKYGFHHVSTEYITINLTPDHPAYSKESAYAMINANRQAHLDNISVMEEIASDLVRKDEIEELKRLANQKYDKRLALYDAGEKQWDTNMSLIMVIRGEK